jgi:hypothetical protein
MKAASTRFVFLLSFLCLCVIGMKRQLFSFLSDFNIGFFPPS